MKQISVNTAEDVESYSSLSLRRDGCGLFSLRSAFSNEVTEITYRAIFRG